MSQALVVENASEICLPQRTGRGVERLRGFALFVRNGRVAWLGPRAELPDEARDAARYDAQGGAVLPALVDCHTHLVYGGDRVEDFARRARGATYEEILAQGGGIYTTVEATRRATSEELHASTLARLESRRRYGIGTTEIKSGYGLNLNEEIRLLEVVRRLRGEGWDVEATLLAAHVVPKEVPREFYVDEIVGTLIPHVAKEGLARFVDVFVEKGAYTIEEGRRISLAAKAKGLFPRIHADQLTGGGGAELAAEVGASSADHLERASEAGLEALARGGVVATLLPGALVFLGDRAPDLGGRLRRHGVEVAVATDANPGSSPLSNLPLAATLAVTNMGLTAEEALRAITLGGANALRRRDVGTLEPGALARFVVLSHPDPRALLYAFGEPVIRETVDASR